MSYWKAIAAAREIPETSLRDAFAEERFKVLHLADALGCDEGDLADEIESLRAEVKDAQEEVKDATRRAEELETSEAAEKIEALERDLAEMTGERDALAKRLAAAQPLLDAYSDTLSFARKFTSLAAEAGVKPRHVRAVPSGKKRSRDAK